MTKIALHEHEFKRSMLTRIRNFGFELEMLTTDDRGEGEREEWVECDGCCGSGEISEFETDENGVETEEWRQCAGCNGDGGWNDTFDDDGASYRLNSLVEAMNRAGLVHPRMYGDSLHDYHCRCAQCRPDRTSPFLAAQEDCTVGVEFITKICSVDSEEDAEQIAKVVGVVDRFHEWKANGYDEDGNHVHVSISGQDDDGQYTFANSRRRIAYRLANLVYATYDWDQAAAGGCRRLRGYNAKPGVDQHASGSWLRDGPETFEHRLWNTPSDAERIWGHIGASIALTRWAFATTFCHPGLTAQAECYDIHVNLDTHQSQIINDIAAYLPSGEYGKQGANVLELVS